jgi:LPXTG-site transpeptidase (sortase) family protein
MKPKILIKQRAQLKAKSKVSKRPPRTLRQKIILSCLITIAACSIFLLLLPYIPRLRYLITKPHLDAAPYHAAAAANKSGQKANPTPESNKPGNRLILPGIGVDTQIIEGPSLKVIGRNQGVWRETNKVNPSMPGNMVIAGHRFLYTATNGGWFYNLPELKVGQKIYVRWDNTMYEYEIYNTRSVLPTQVDIRNADPQVPKKLTMYTCYPLGSTAKRFVVEAKQL